MALIYNPCYKTKTFLHLIRYLKTHLSVAHPDQAELESMRTELHFARRQAEMLKWVTIITNYPIVTLTAHISVNISIFREENQRLSAELQKYLAVESLSKEEPSEEITTDHDEQINWGHFHLSNHYLLCLDIKLIYYVFHVHY